MTEEGSGGKDGERSAGDSQPDLLRDVVAVARDGVLGAVAGFVGAVAMTLVLFVAATLGAFDFGSVAGLATILGFGTNLLVGYAIFLVGGMTAWPLLFVAIGERLPGGEAPLRGIAFATVMWTGFASAFYTGQSGPALASYAVATLLAHWTYGFVLASAFDAISEKVSGFPSTTQG